MSEHISALELRRRLGDILDQVRQRRHRFVIEREGTTLDAVLPVETLAAMERLLREYQFVVLERQRGAGVSEAEAATVADKAKHGTRARSRR